MGKGSSKDLVSISEIENALDKALEIVAMDVGKEIQAAFESAISDFYSSYSPNSYHRTKTMYQFSSGYNGGSKKPLFEKIGKLKYEAGITVSPSHVAGNPYKKNHGLDVDPEWVFDVSYLKGIHGFNRSDVLYQRDNTGRIKMKTDKDKSTDADKNGRMFRTNEWKPGYNPLGGLKDKVGIFLDDYSIADIINTYHKTYKIWDHIPTNSVPPDVQINRDYKNILRNIGAKLDAAFIKSFT